MAGQNVTRTTAATVPAIHRAWSFAASEVAKLSMGVWRGEGIIPQRVTSTLQGRLFAGVPNPRQDWFWFWYCVEKAVESRNSAYIWKTKNLSGQVVALTALHPDQVFPYMYRVKDDDMQYPVSFTPFWPQPPDVNGRGVVTVGRETIIHIRGDGGMGELVPKTPIQMFAVSIGIALARQDYQANLLENGVQGGMAVSFPAGMSFEQAKKWKELYQNDNAGTIHAGETRAFGGGATFQEIGMTPNDAQIVEMGLMSIHDVLHMTGVPGWALEMEAKQQKSTTPEQDDARWVHHGLESRLKRIEGALYADVDIFGPGSRDYPQFDTANSIHPDSATADNIAHQQIQDGRMLVDEWRVPRGMGPLPDGLGKVPQVTPVGGAPNIAPAGPAASPTE